MNKNVMILVKIKQQFVRKLRVYGVGTLNNNNNNDGDGEGDGDGDDDDDNNNIRLNCYILAPTRMEQLDVTILLQSVYNRDVSKLYINVTSLIFLSSLLQVVNKFGSDTDTTC